MAHVLSSLAASLSGLETLPFAQFRRKNSARRKYPSHNKDLGTMESDDGKMLDIVPSWRLLLRRTDYTL